MLKRTRDSARLRKLDFSLTEEWIQGYLDIGRCQVTGLTFDFKVGTGAGNNGRNPYGPSIDRKDPSKGYTGDNCQVVLWMLNAAKGSWSMDEVMTLARALIDSTNT
jgi:hypothetical protein